MKRNPTPNDPGLRMKMPSHGDAGGFAVSSPDCLEARQIGPTTLSHMNEVNITKTDIWRTAEAIKRAGCRDVLIIGTAEYVRFIVTIKFPNLVRR
jgi:hypothetical protein